MSLIKKFWAILLSLSIILSIAACGEKGCRKHTDEDGNGVCDECFGSVFVYFDFYAIGDLATKTSDNQKLTNYFEYTKQNNQNTVLLSTGNMWRDTDSGATVWMNEMGFAASALGKKDFELGNVFMQKNVQKAKFPFLAINVYDKNTDKLYDFCAPSTMVEDNGIKIGVIGAVGNYYSDVEAQYNNVVFKLGNELTELVKQESESLRKKGADFIVYLLHDGYGEDVTSKPQDVTTEQISSYYDTELSDGYVDLVFEAYSEHSYRIKDEFGVYHLQNAADAVVGLSHAEVAFNTVTEDCAVRNTELVSQDIYESVEYVPQQEEQSEEENKENKDEQKDPVKNNDKTDTNNKNNSSSNCKKHVDKNEDDVCDKCKNSVLVYFDFYNINDLHGKLADADSHIGVDELTTYLKNARKTDQNAIFLSSGDMWQGAAESNMTKGLIMTDWMNQLDFTAMAIGNHEYDWGGEYIADNEELAEFPFLAINIYDRATNKIVDYCDASVMVESDGLQIGIIGAVGDCYSSIAVDKCDDVYFKSGRELTSLVKAESDRLREKGADFIVYILHDGYGQTNLGSVQQISASKIASYYDVSLSDGYVDLVFEGHTHQGYMLQDQYGVYHLQNRGDNKGGISHAEVAINSVTEKATVTEVDLVATYEYQDLEDDPIVEELLDKYDEQISPANKILGYNSSYRDSDELQQTIAKLYYETGFEAWGDKYDIVLGGGFMSIRSPYNLSIGDVTYSDLQSMFPFDNQLTLCSVKGRDLTSKFLSARDRYYVHCGDYGQSIKNNINPNDTYYIIVDTYTADYRYNNLTIVERYDENIFARDLLAEYIKNGGYS